MSKHSGKYKYSCSLLISLIYHLISKVHLRKTVLDHVLTGRTETVDAFAYDCFSKDGYFWINSIRILFFGLDREL